jgi:tetratricopeptide (TPR) repeat protein
MLLLSIAFLVALAGQNTTTFEELSARAAQAREANDVTQAVQLYRQAVSLNLKWVEGWWYLGSLSYDSDRYADGREALAHVVALDPSAGPAWALLGLCEFEAGDYSQALEHIQRGLIGRSTAFQMETVLRYHEALLLTHKGDFDKALEHYAWFAKSGVQNPELIIAMGLAALRRPLLPKDVRNDQELLATAGEAAYLTMAGKYVDAREIFERLLQRFPNAHYVHYMYGCFVLGANSELGIRELQRELEITPLSAAANSMLAFALLEHGDAAAALVDARVATLEQPNSELAQYVLGRSLTESGDLAGGIEHLELAEKMDPADPQPHISLATAYSKVGRPLDARRERQRSVQLAIGAPTGARP